MSDVNDPDLPAANRQTGDTGGVPRPRPPAERRAYTVREAAALYGVSAATITRAIHRTEPPFLRAKKVGGRYRIHEAALEDWWRQLPDA